MNLSLGTEYATQVLELNEYLGPLGQHLLINTMQCWSPTEVHSSPPQRLSSVFAGKINQVY